MAGTRLSIKKDFLFLLFMNINTIYHDNFLNNNLPDKSVDLIIADPPYFEIKGEFDFVWNSMQDYLIDVEKWFIEFKRILKEKGTLLYYGDSKKIAYSQIIGDKYFGLLSNVTIHIFDRQTNKIRIEDARSFINTTERMLMYSNDVYNLTQCVYSIRDYIRSEIIKSKGKIIFKEINKALGAATTGGGIASACLSLNKTEPAMITKEMYSKLRFYLNPYNQLWMYSTNRRSIQVFNNGIWAKVSEPITKEQAEKELGKKIID